MPETETETTPTPELLGQLAILQYEHQDFTAAERTLDRLVAIAPAQVSLDTYRLLAKLKAVRLGPDGARGVMGAALEAHSHRTEFVAAYAETLPPDKAVPLLERHAAEVGADPSRLAYLLLRITTIRAPLQRRARGLPPDFGLSWEDTFRWPDAETLPALKAALETEIAGGSRRATARLDLAYIAAAAGEWERAEDYLAEARNSGKRTPADFTAFGKAFHAGLDAMNETDLLAGLVPVQRIAAAPNHTAETIFIASDRIYFERFTLPFLRQLDGLCVPVDTHVHIFDGGPAAWQAAREATGGLRHIGVTLTAEAADAAAHGSGYARAYYHAVRYVRFFEELRRGGRRMWMFDADVQALRDPRPFLASLAPYDLALRTNPCSFEPALKITAACVGVAPTPRGLDFARRVAACIVHFKNRGTWNWGVDQLALFSSYAHMSDDGRAPRTLFLDNMAMNDKVGDTGAIRFLSGIDKHLAANAGSPS